MAGTEHSVWSPLRHRNFRLLLASDAISNIGDWLYNIVLLVYVFERTHSPAWVSAASIVRIAPEIGLSTLGGVVVDRYDRRKVMVLSNLSRVVLMGALSLVALTSAPTWMALAITFLSTALGTPYLAAAIATLPSLVPEADLAAANGLVSGLGYLTLGLGPALGGILLLVSSPWVVFALNGVSFLLGAILLRSLKAAQPRTADVRASVRQGLVEAFSAIKTSPQVAVVVVLIPLVTFIPGNSFVLLVLVSKDLIGTGAEGVTFLFAAIGFGGMAGTWASHRYVDAPRPGMLLLVTTVAIGASFGGLAMARVPFVAYLLCALTGASVIVYEVVSATLAQRLLPQEVMGRVFGIMNTLVYSGILVGSLFAPIFVRLWGLPQALVIAGAIPALLVFLLFGKLRRADQCSITKLNPLAPRLAVLQEVGILCAAPRSTLEILARSVSEEQVAAGHEVMSEGEPADAFFVVASGHLKVFSRGEKGNSTQVNQLRDGDYFGEIGLLEKIPRTATVVAVTSCNLYRISGEAFLEAVSQAPVISGALLSGVLTSMARTHPSYRSTPPTTTESGETH